MSDVLYPLGLIEDLRVSRFDRTLLDEFEDGGQAARSLWAAGKFKRTFKVRHAALTLGEAKQLRGFYKQRGRVDSFWFRDNVHREGNAKVRFGKELEDVRRRGASLYETALVETSPVRALLEMDEVTAAAGAAAPFVWLDPNRETYISHAGTVTVETQLWDMAQLYKTTWQEGALVLGNILGQWQHLHFDGENWARSSANVAHLATGTPACTLFAIVKQSTSAAAQVLISLGGSGAGAALGLAMDASNYYTPYVGGTPTWTNAKSLNSPANTWRSVCCVWAAGSTNVSLYVNGALVGTDSNSRNWAFAPLAVGNAADGTKVANPGEGMANCSLGQAAVWSAALSLAQIKAVHNLMAHQYGLALVA